MQQETPTGQQKTSPHSQIQSCQNTRQKLEFANQNQNTQKVHKKDKVNTRMNINQTRKNASKQSINLQTPEQ